MKIFVVLVMAIVLCGFRVVEKIDGVEVCSYDAKTLADVEPCPLERDVYFDGILQAKEKTIEQKYEELKALVDANTLARSVS